MAQKALKKNNNNLVMAVAGIVLVAVVGVVALQVSGARDLNSFFSGRGFTIWRKSSAPSISTKRPFPSSSTGGSSCSATANGRTDTQYSANGSVSCSSSYSGGSSSSSYCTVNGQPVDC